MKAFVYRNPQIALMALREDLLGRQHEDGVRRIREPVVVAVSRPEERVLSWPELRRDPAQELSDALVGILQAKPLVPLVAESLQRETQGFHFSANALAVHFGLDFMGFVDLTAFTSDNDLMGGAFGQLGLQLSLMLELVSREADRARGTLTIIHSSGMVDKKSCQALLPDYYSPAWQSGYVVDGNLPMPIDTEHFWSDVEMFCEVQEKAVGFKSKFARHLLLPLTLASKAEGKDEALKACESIQATDWRRAMEHYIG